MRLLAIWFIIGATLYVKLAKLVVAEKDAPILSPLLLVGQSEAALARIAALEAVSPAGEVAQDAGQTLATAV